MSDLESDRKRFIEVTAANLRYNHLYLTGHHDFFPLDAIGGPKKNLNAGVPIEIFLDGLNETIRTDIGSDGNGKPRRFLRDRRSLGRFYKYHAVNAGEKVCFEHFGERRYHLSVARPGLNGHCPTAAEFFSGIGLVRLALEGQGWKVVFANDIDADKAEMYRKNWPNDDHLVVGDIHELDPETVPTCDLFTASFPCNDLSIAGRWEGLNGKQSSAFWGLVQILRQMGDRRPQLLLIENVLGFLMSHQGKDFEQALFSLNELGYSVDALILNAVHWVPQSRARLFVVGKRRKEQGKSFTLVSDARPPSLIDFIRAHQELDWDLLDLPPLPRSSKLLADIVEDLPDNDPHWWNKKRAEYFMNQMSDRHKAEASSMINGKRISYATAFRRVRNEKSMAELRTDGIAGCLRTPRGGSGRQILFKAGKGNYQVRLLTARECARLQGVPDSYKIEVPLNQALFGFGDAVCVPVLEWVINHCLNQSVSGLPIPSS